MNDMYSHSQWLSIINERISAEADRWVRAQVKRPSPERWSRDSVMERLSIVLPDVYQLLVDALRDHIHLYGHMANDEVGFDLGIRAHDMLIAPSGGHVIVFATMDAKASKRLHALEGVSKILRTQVEAWAAKYKIAQQEHSDVLGGVLLAAVPHATFNMANTSANDIVDCAIKGHIVARHYFEQTLLAAGGGGRPRLH